MGSIKYFLFLIFSTALLSSCSLLGVEHIFEKGYTNEHGQYVPKRDRFQFKQYDGGTIPENLDTVNVYRLETMYFDQVKMYPLEQEEIQNNAWGELNRQQMFMRFYPGGRVLLFSIPLKKPDGSINSLTVKDLNPNSPNYSKAYYRADGHNIEVEDFVYGEGYGRYIISDFTLSSTGDTLRRKSDRLTEVYVRHSLPEEWKSYNVDW